MKTTIAQIAIASPLRTTFDYLIPSEKLGSYLFPGQRVEVPFGKQTKVGVVLTTKNESDYPLDKLKKLHAVLDDASLYTNEIFELCQWASEYYHYCIGEILLSCLPLELRKGKIVTLQKTPLKTAGITSTPPTLNPEQLHAVETINAEKKFAAILLEGITGSGKTEVYCHCIEQVLQQNKQVLVLVPEIGLTPQTVSRFEQRFQQPMSVLHSGLTSKQRTQEWLRARLGESRIIIGTRSAILTPLEKLGLIIIDEEHDLSFKQQSGFRYCARSLAIMRAKINDIPIVLGSATPSLESLYNASKQRYLHLTLKQRAGKAVVPNYHIIDIRHKQCQEGLSPMLVKQITKHLEANNQVLLFLNRRGYAPTLICHECGWTAECPHCDAKMTYHSHSNDLHCHHCSTQRPRYPNCLACKSKELVTMGIGTEKLEEVLNYKFPDFPVLRIDRDSTRKKNTLQKMLDQVQTGAPQILVGTQMLAKGHHFSNVTMVGILDADSGLLSSDFRALERLGQTLLQVAGRAGREEKKGEVFIQTHCPTNPQLQLLLEKGYNALATSLLSQRKVTHLPPYSYMALLKAEGRNLEKPMNFLTDVKSIAEKICDKQALNLFGPIPAAMVRKGGQFRAHLLVQSPSRKTLQAAITELMIDIDKLPASKRMRWSIDIDPQEIQ